MTKEEVETKYGGMAIAEIETDLLGAQSALTDARRVFIIGLAYLDMTRRYKENPRFKNSSFKVYIGDMFHMTECGYQDEKMAFNCFPEETKKHGPGLIAKIKHSCGVTKIKSVLDKIEQEDGKRQRPIKREEITHIIKKNARPKPEKVGPVPDRETLLQRCQRFEETIKEQRTTIAAQEKQIVRLKKRVRELEEEKGQFDSVLTAVRPFFASA